MQHWTCLYEIWTNTETYVFRRTIPIFCKTIRRSNVLLRRSQVAGRKSTNTLHYNKIISYSLSTQTKKVTKTTTTIYLETDIRLCPTLYKLTTKIIHRNLHNRKLWKLEATACAKHDPEREYWKRQTNIYINVALEYDDWCFNWVVIRLTLNK